MSLKEEVIKKLKSRRQRISSGYVNCIPTPFKRFRYDWVGLEQESYMIVTSFTKGGKSQFTSYAIIYQTLLYAYRHPEKNIDVTLLYFPLEETAERIMERFMSYLIYEFAGVRCSPRELRSTQQAVEENHISFLESEEIQKILDFFESHIIFSEESNPTGIMKFCKKYAEAHGKTLYRAYETTDDFGNKVTKELFRKYIPNNPNAYVVPIIDTINFIDAERGMTMKQSMDKMSEYCAKILRNRYKMSPVVIQQQAFEQEKVDEFKMKSGNLRPSVAGLGDSKTVSRDANLVLGLFSPARFGIKNYMGYNIELLGDSARFLEVIINRDGQMGGMIGLYFDGACSYFKELPIAIRKTKDGQKQETDEIKQFYNWFEHRDEPLMIEEKREQKSNKSFLITTLKQLTKWQRF